MIRTRLDKLSDRLPRRLLDSVESLTYLSRQPVHGWVTMFDRCPHLVRRACATAFLNSAFIASEMPWLGLKGAIQVYWCHDAAAVFQNALKQQREENSEVNLVKFSHEVFETPLWHITQKTRP